MIRSASSERKTLTEVAQQELRQAITGGARYIVAADYSSADESLVDSCEYHLPDAFDFLVWRRGPTRLRNAPNEGSQ